MEDIQRAQNMQQSVREENTMIGGEGSTTVSILQGANKIQFVPTARDLQGPTLIDERTPTHLVHPSVYSGGNTSNLQYAPESSFMKQRQAANLPAFDQSTIHTAYNSS